WELMSARIGSEKAVATVLLSVTGAVLLTWRFLSVGAWAGLTGRVWIVALQTFLVANLAFRFLYEWALWQGLDRREQVLNALPWVAGTVILVKLIVAGRSLVALRDQNEIGTLTAGRLFGIWALTAAALAVLLIWLMPKGAMPAYGVVMFVMLIVPFAR